MPHFKARYINENIIKYLEAVKRSTQKSRITHSYIHCPRWSTPFIQDLSEHAIQVRLRHQKREEANVSRARLHRLFWVHS